ncbi:HotDog domain-containing protein [Peziza echinospora]|nr:HotDog domain-containing protein [Peziza echinospora]
MRDSFHSLTIPFTKDEWLVDTYVNANGQLRMGSLFQDLDALAGVIAYKHTGPAPAIVTAAVDRISIISPMVDKFYDLELSGFVSYVGRSSMEISIEVRKVDCPAGEEPLLLTCAFTMVALDPVTKKAVKINPLIVETEEEKRIFGKGEAYKNSKKALADASLTKVTPNDEESDIIHGLWMQNQKLKGLPHPPTNPHLMSTTKIHSTFLMQPQNRNRHSFMIFGGLLLKLTFELAFCCASSSTNSRPTFISLDPSTFLSPVPVGAVLYLTATIAYAEPASREEGGGTKVQVRVESRVKDVDGGGSGKEKRETETGVFNYTFRVEEEGWEVMPVTYGEFMDYVDARRRVGLQKELGVHNVDGTSSGIIKGKL